MTRIFLHVGDHKTGTSTIQSALAARQRSDNADLKALYYPLSARKGQTAHHNLFWSMTQEFRFDPSLGHWSDVQAELEETAPDIAILSSEAFENLKEISRLKALTEEYLEPLGPVKIILYVRPHFDRLRSAFAQRKKTGQIIGDIEKFIDDAIHTKTLTSFAQRLDRWRSVFGNRLDVRLYKRDHLENEDILYDFLLKAVGLDHDTFESVLKHQANRNIAPGLTTMSLIEPIAEELETVSNKEKRIAVEKFILAVFMKQISTLFPNDHKPIISKPAAQRLAEAAMHDAEQLDTGEFANTPVFVACLEKELAKAPDAQEDAISLPAREREIHEAYKRVIVAATKRHISLLKKTNKL